MMIRAEPNGTKAADQLEDLFLPKCSTPSSFAPLQPTDSMGKSVFHEQPRSDADRERERLDLLRSLSPPPHRAASRHPAHHQLTRYPVNKCTGECPSRDANTTLVEDAVERLHGAIRFSQQFSE
jgi:hypothetical protein